MQFNVKHDIGFSIISLEGDFLSEGEQGELRKKVCALVDRGKTRLIIDLTDSKHINSCGLGALVCAYTTLRRAGGDLKLAGASRSVEELLKITQLTKIFEISPTVEQAIAEYRSQMH
ncbi:MAG: hypothetical protein C0417_13725 [Chlorobiaceae bacterium]|nr:hypothetical protein [Chlorobiaceae bacterium]